MKVPGDLQREVKRIRTEPWEPMSEDWELRVQEREDGRRKSFWVTFQRPSHESFLKMSREIMSSGTVEFGRVGVISVSVKRDFGKMIEVCYGLKVCVPVKCMCWDPSPPCDDIRRCYEMGLWGVVRIRWGHKGRALMIGSVPSEETVRTQWEARKGALTRNQVSQHLHLGRPGSRTLRKQISVFDPPSHWYFVMATWTD